MNTSELIVPRLTTLSIQMEELNDEYNSILDNQLEMTKYVYRIKSFIEKNMYTHDIKDVLRGYRDKHIDGYYIACSTDDIINNCYKSVRMLYEAGYRE